jgi:predicted transcriptional regulator
MTTITAKAYRKSDGGEIMPGDPVTDFRGEPQVFHAVTRPADESRGAKIQLGDAHGPEVYASVIPDLEVREPAESGPVAPVVGAGIGAGYVVRAVLPADLAGREWLIAAEDTSRGRWATWHAWARDDGSHDYAWGHYFYGGPDPAGNRRRALADLADRAGITPAVQTEPAARIHDGPVLLCQVQDTRGQETDMATSETNQQVTAVLPRELVAAVDAYGKSNDRSRSWVIGRAVEEFLARQDGQAPAKPAGGRRRAAAKQGGS